ncbi:MAG: RNB domain-containing ribonuclease, partial [Actinobacteria bacterium]|nr:RNB domain-containing ribonuclease [Actinomycetota bacterium]
VAADGVTETPTTLTDADGAPREVDSAFVPPPLAATLLADDLVDVEVSLDDKGATAAEARLVDRPRKMVVGVVRTGPAKLVLEPDHSLGSGWIDLEPAVADRLPTSVGRQVVVLIADGEGGKPVGRALVAGPHVVGSPQAVRATAVVVALGRAAPSLVPGGAAGAGLDPVAAATTHMRLVGMLAGGGRGGAAGLSVEGYIPGAEHELWDRRAAATVTIDDAKTRDVDDAIEAIWDGEPEGAVEVIVHIADVAAAVGYDSDADRYARVAATTAYLRVGDNAPMLDPVLSEGELSLLPGQDRRVLSVHFQVAPDGAISDVTVENNYIRSDAKLSYEALEAWMAGDRSAIHAEAGDTTAPLADEVLTNVMEAARRLGVERDARQTFEDLFTSAEVEPAIVDGKLSAVPAEPHADAYRLIERLMVAANEAVAGWAVEHDVPALYRAHVGLAADRAERLRAAVEAAGADVPSLDDPDAEGDQVVAEVLAEIERLAGEGRDADRELLISAATTSTARATYDPDPSHHRGLGASAYTHFTSPIRRYADLVVHRQIRAALAGEAPLHDPATLSSLAEWLDARAGAVNHASARERGDLWARLLDRGYLDAPEPAVVTGLTANGLRIRIPRLGLTGFITAERLLDLPKGERGRLEVDEHGLTTTSGPWRLGSTVHVDFLHLDDTARPVFRLARTPTA